MKIAIMTQPLGQNYGGIIQAYALQKVLRGLGHEVVTVDYRMPEPNSLYKLIRFAYRVFQKITGKRKAPIAMEYYFPFIFENTIKFIADNINCSERVESSSQLFSHFKSQSYEVVVVGSDQAWRPKYSPNIGNYFLDFLEGEEIKRVAYATSFGVDDWEFGKEETERCAGLATKFDQVSVREKSGIDLCKKFLGVDARFVLDPTMLLSKEDYIKIFKNAEYNKQGVFCYLLDESSGKSEISELVSDYYKGSMFTTYARLPLNDLSSSNIEDYTLPSIQEWLKSFYLAKFVVTDSFHGCVFSIIFNVPFIVVANRQRGIARFESILSELGLQNRMVMSVTEVDMDKLSEPIDWAEVNSKLSELRRESRCFLEAATNAPI